MRQLGVFQVLVSGFLFGFLGLFGKKAFSLGLSPGEFLALRFLLASLGLGLWIGIKNKRGLRLPWSDALRAFLLGALGYAFFSTCFFSALQGLSVSLTVLLLYLYPVWVTLGSRFILGEKLHNIHFVALPASLLGLALLLWGELQVRDSLSLALGIAASLLYSAYILASRRCLPSVPPFPAAFYVILGAASTLTLLHFRTLPSSQETWAVVGATAVLSTIFSISLFLSGLQKLGAADASLLSLAEPVTAVLIGVLVYGDTFLPLQWLGAILILVGLLLVAFARKPEIPLEATA